MTLFQLTRVAALGLLLTTAAQAQGVTPKTVTERPAIFQALTPEERELLMAASGLSSQDQFLLGRLPDELPFTLPELPQRRVVGTLQQSSGTVVIVQTSLAAPAAREAAWQALKKAGWTEQYPRRQEIFLSDSATQSESFSPLCKPGVSRTLFVTAGERSSGSQLRYDLTLSDSSGCPASANAVSPATQNFYAPVYSMSPRRLEDEFGALGLTFPSLRAPAGVRAQFSGSIEGDGDYTGYASLNGPQDTAALRDHYVAALQGQGWKLVDNAVLGGQNVTRLQRQAGKRELVATLSFKARPELDLTENGTTLRRHDVQLRIQLF